MPVAWLSPAHHANPLQLIKSVAYIEKGGNLAGGDEEGADQSQTATAQMASSTHHRMSSRKRILKAKVRRRGAAVARAVPAAAPAPRISSKRSLECVRARHLRLRHRPSNPPAWDTTSMNTRPELSLQCIWSAPLLIGQPLPYKRADDIS